MFRLECHGRCAAAETLQILSGHLTRIQTRFHLQAATALDGTAAGLMSDLLQRLRGRGAAGSSKTNCTRISPVQMADIFEVLVVRKVYRCQTCTACCIRYDRCLRIWLQLALSALHADMP